MRSKIFVVGLFGATVWATACKVESGCYDTRTCPSPDDGDGGPDSGADVVAPPGCDLTKSPKDSPACVDDTVAVFVSPSGDDGAAGTKAGPVKSIGKGVELAASRGRPRVYVCEGTYDSAVELRSPIAIHGGLSCAWAYTGAKPKLAPSKGVALRVTKVTGNVLVEDVEIVGSADPGVSGDSAIAVFVSESASVTFRNAAMTAGAATAGAKGASRTNHTGAVAMKGANGGGVAGGMATSCACMDASSSTGGAGAAGAGGGIQNGSSSPPVGAANSGLTGATTCTDGQAGTGGNSGGAGSPATSAGTLSVAGWSIAVQLENAPNGGPAQGGGGGGAKTDFMSPGGGGGCGGCGGAGGGVGASGGSSFALLAFRSTIGIEGGALASGAGGLGGPGGDGQAGQGAGGAGTGLACNGGAGGDGAGGSGGGGGAGGHSAPIGFVGTEPRVSGATLNPGAKGGGGGGGNPGAGPGTPGTAGTPGPEGKAQNTLAL